MIAAVLVAALAMTPAASGLAEAQAAKDARVTVTVVDQTQSVILNAKVTVTPSPAAGAPIAPVTTNDKGIAVISGLAPGKYTILAEFPGFQSRTIKDAVIKSGDNKHVAVLAIEGFQ